MRMQGAFGRPMAVTVSMVFGQQIRVFDELDDVYRHCNDFFAGRWGQCASFALSESS